MAYEPLHHKYRPQTFADLVGQETIATTLGNAMKTQRIAPAYLLTGARGTGKTSTARIMAKSLNCLSFDAPTTTPCGKCEMCLGIIRGNALDITEIDAASNTGVDNIRDLIERSQFAPTQARYKVYAIDECHMLSTAAFNALLKTLEEPPDRVVFILATTDPQRVLPTIISRCQRFDFRRIPLVPMVEHLTKIAEIEKIKIIPEALLLIGQMAQGGLRDAESLLDQLSLHEGEIDNEAVWNLVGSVPERDLLAVLEAISQNNAIALIEKTRQIIDRGREPLVLLQSLAGFYRDLLIAKSADRAYLVALTAATWAQLKEISASFRVENILAGQQLLRSAEVQIRNSTQPRLWLEVTLAQLLNIPSVVTSPEIRANMAPQPQIAADLINPTQVAVELVSKIQSPQPAISANIPVETATDQVKNNLINQVQISAERVFSDQDLARSWQQLIKFLSPPSKAVFVSKATFLEINAENVVIGLKDKGLKEIAIKKRDELEKCCAQVFDRKVKILFRFISADIISSSNSDSISDSISSQNSDQTSKQNSNQDYARDSEPKFENSFDKNLDNKPNVAPPVRTASDVDNFSKNAPEKNVASSSESHDSDSSPESSAIKNVVTFFDGQIIDL